MDKNRIVLDGRFFMRLDKYISATLPVTRSEAKKLIKQGKITANNEIVKNPDMKIDETSDRICFEGQDIQYSHNKYFVFNKPAGCVTALRDGKYPTVIDYFEEKDRRKLSPVGRLDLDTEGVLLLTDDGELLHSIIRPSNHIPKTYFAILDRECPAEAVELFERGVDLGDGEITRPAGLTFTDNPSQVRLVIYDGKFHQVKRMFEKVGCRVTYLRREAYGKLSLEKLVELGITEKLLEKGQYAEISGKVLEELL